MKSTERKKPRRQCRACPWRVDVDPNDIPGGYNVEKHKALRNTIAEPGTIDLASPLHIMACHETPEGAEKACVGWLHHQLGEGNNLALRMKAMRGEVDTDLTLVGDQHSRLEDTFPK